MSAWANFMRGIQRQDAWVYKEQEKQEREKQKKKAEEMKRLLAEEERLKKLRDRELAKMRERQTAYQKFVHGFKKEYQWVHGKELAAKEREKQRLAAIEKVKHNYSGWQPRLFSGNGITLKNVKDLQTVLDYKVNEFEIYVDDTNHFVAKLPALKTKWANLKHLNFVHKAKVDYDDPYFASLGAAYILSYRCGLTKQHLQFSENTPKIITSLMRYFLYFHMQRYLQKPKLLEKMKTYDESLIVQDLITKSPIVKKYERKFEDTKEIPILWWNRKKKNGRDIKDLKAEHYADGNGQLGIVYHECVSAKPENEETDFERIIVDAFPFGFTAEGQNYLQQAIESFVYAILGSQARTRWGIVNQGARSLQTQDVFYRLVSDTILKDNATLSISDMRKAIKDTNVVLNLVVSPGVILLPGDLKIVKTRVAGWNNILTTATESMRFGENANVNNPKSLTQKDSKSLKDSLKDSSGSSLQDSSERSEEKDEDSSQQPAKKPAYSYTGTVSYISSGVLIALLTRLAIFLL